MSTKTTFKRVALVAVVALGLGGLSTVAANAVGQTPTAVSVGTIPLLAKNQTSLIPITVTLPTGASATDSFTVVAKVTSAPVGSAFATVAGASTAAAGTGAGSSFITGVIPSGSTNIAKMTWTASSTTGAIGNLGLGTPTQKSDLTPSVASDFEMTNWTTGVSTKETVYLNFQPDVAGSYTFLVSANGTGISNTATYTAGDPAVTFTASTANGVSNVIVAPQLNAPVAASTNGELVKISVTDSSGAAAVLGGSDAITLTPNQSTTTITPCAVSNGAFAYSSCTGAVTGTAGVVLKQTNFLNGKAYVLVKDSSTSATTIVLTATGTGTLSSTITGTASITTTKAVAGTALTLGDDASFTRPGSGHIGVSSNADTASTTATSHTYAINDAVTGATVGATEVVDAYMTDTSGDITGLKGAVIDLGGVTLTATSATKYTGDITLSGALATAGDSFTLNAGGTSGQYVTVASATPAYTSGYVAAGPALTLRGTIGGAIALTGKVVDQFGAAVANAPVTVAVTGRNATTIATGLASDANGYVSYTVTDASTSTTSLTDTVTFTLTGAANSNSKNIVTINYGTSTVSSVALTGGNTTSSVANATVTVNPIYAADGAENGAVAFTAVVKDANGALLVGVPVTFSVAGTGAAVPSNKAVVYTDATGTATSSVYAWLAGTYTVTATAGAKSTTGTVTFADTTSAYARTISAVAVGNVVKATVLDRFGNPVQGATVYIKTAGGANVGGLFKTSTTTGADGTASFVVSGDGTAVLDTNLDPSAVAGTLPSDQSAALAGNLTAASGSTAAVAFTASTAGTATKSETYVGASYAPAGVNSASVTVTGNDVAATTQASAATDAANEATDAANAATDAANAAADAADAATSAAQDASAQAQAALAAVNALSAKITVLAAQIAKIVKKLKA